MLSAISHTRTKAALHLIDNLRDASAVRHPALDSLGDKFLGIFLEIAVFAARRHRGKRTHAAIDFEAAALIQFHFTRAFQRAGKQRPDHDGAAARGKRFDDVAAVFDAAVGDDALAHLVRSFRAIHNRSELRYAV